MAAYYITVLFLTYPKLGTCLVKFWYINKVPAKILRLAAYRALWQEYIHGYKTGHSVSSDCMQTNQELHSYSFVGYILSNFKVRCDVTFGRLRTSLQVTIKRAYHRNFIYTTHTFYVYLPEVSILPEETLHLFLKLIRVLCVAG